MSVLFVGRAHPKAMRKRPKSEKLVVGSKGSLHQLGLEECSSVRSMVFFRVSLIVHNLLHEEGFCRLYGKIKEGFRIKSQNDRSCGSAEEYYIIPYTSSRMLKT